MKRFVYYLVIFTIAISIVFIGYYAASVTRNLAELIFELHSKIEIYEQYRQGELATLKDLLTKMADLIIKNDTKKAEIDEQQEIDIKDIRENQKSHIEDIKENIEEVRDIQSRIEEELKIKKQIDVDNIDKIKKANLDIYNTTVGITGSGSHIVIEDKHYILTCAHLMKNEEDNIWGVNNGTWYPLKLVKLNMERDLALFEIRIKNLPYLEISNEFPKEGSEILVIGNPGGLKDIVTDGVISEVREYDYLLTNKVYCGNSGGSIIYKGKIVGVITMILTYFDELTPPIVVNYSMGTNLESIREFLEME